MSDEYVKPEHSIVKVGHPVTLRVENSIDVCAIDASTLEIRSRWVSDRSPTNEDSPILAMEGEGCLDFVALKWVEEDGWGGGGWYDRYETMIYEKYIICWMPLPQPPK